MVFVTTLFLVRNSFTCKHQYSSTFPWVTWNNLLVSEFLCDIKNKTDSNVVFRIQDKLLMGRIRTIFTLAKTDTTFLLIDYTTTVHYFSCFINNDELKYSSIYSCLKKDFSTRLVQTIDIVEKCVYFENPNGKCYFMRFPNLEHSS